MPAKFTNKYNLPEEFVNAVMQDDHVVNGDISVTTLIDAPQIRMLKKTHDYDIDIVDIIGMVQGTGLHTVLERASKSTYDARILQQAISIFRRHDQPKVADYIKKFLEDNVVDFMHQDLIIEQNVTMEVEGWTVSGTFDRYSISERHLKDYKNTSASAVMFPETKKSWNAQLNVYALMMRSSGLPVEKASIIAVLKDWSKMRVMTSRDYPTIPVFMHNIPLLDDDVVMDYLSKRVILHQRADAGENIPCSPKDRWAKPDAYAVMKKGSKRAVRVFDRMDMADNYIVTESFKHKGELSIEYRKGQSMRCANGYCPVADVCQQYAKEKQEAVQEAQDM